MNVLARLWDALKGNSYDDGYRVGYDAGLGDCQDYEDGYRQARRDAEQLVGHRLEMGPEPWVAEEC